MGHDTFPDQNELLGKVIVSCRYRVDSDGHDLDSFIGGIPKNTPYLTLTATRAPMSDDWYDLREAYENEGYSTHLRRTNGKTRTRSGTCHHAPTQLYVW